jgi:hypothetical protein
MKVAGLRQQRARTHPIAFPFILTGRAHRLSSNRLHLRRVLLMGSLFYLASLQQAIPCKII